MDMESDIIHLCVTSHPENLKRIRAAISGAMEGTKISKKDSDRIVLAVDEACSNIIKHCCRRDRTRKIDLTIEADHEKLIISIIDNGPRFDISKIQSRDINEIKPGGLGIHIMKQIMDFVEYSHTPEGLNRVRLIKKF
jgi:anti-sigma regulatory factor (Ser/Thr protein kinase)